MDRQKVTDAIEAADQDAVVALFKEASEDDRKAVAKLVVDLVKEHGKNEIIELKPGSFRFNPKLGAAQVAAIACCTLGQLQRLGRLGRVGGEHAYRVLRDRRPSWCTQWARLMLDDSPFHWPWVRQLIRDGVCRRPDTESYVLGMISGVVRWRFAPILRGEASLAKALLDDPELLEGEIWRLFEVEGGGEHSLAANDKYASPELCWDKALVKLSAKGSIPRRRLLDASLDALERGFAQFRAGWFSRFHEALQPSTEERLERADRYLALLASPIPPTVSFALKAVQQIDKKNPMPADRLVKSLKPVLLARQKGTVRAALKLLGQVAKREPAWQSQAALAAVEALAHEATEIQSSALDLIERHGDPSDPSLADTVASYCQNVAPSLRTRLEPWLKAAETIETPTGSSLVNLSDLEARVNALDAEMARLAGVDQIWQALREGRLEITAIELEGTEYPRLDPEHEIRPVQDLDELIDVAAAVIENPDQIDDVERVFDGISRLCAKRPTGFETRTGPLLKRAKKLASANRWLPPFAGCGVLPDLLGLILTWLTGEIAAGSEEKPYDRPRPVRHDPTTEYHLSVSHFLSWRSYELASRVSRQDAGPLLSAPTHRGGWIAPHALLERAIWWQQRPGEPASSDQILGLLRLAPDGRGRARAVADKLTGELGGALRYALGGTAARIGKSAALWVAAARARTPRSDDPNVEKRHRGLGPDAGLAARYEPSIRKWDGFVRLGIRRKPAAPRRVPCDLPTVLFHANQGHYFHLDGTEVAWSATVWPLNREPFFADGAEVVAGNLDWWEAEWGNRAFLDPLLDPDVSLGPMATLLLALGLAAKEPGEHGLATDAAIGAIEDGRLDGRNLGTTMAWLWPTGLVKAARWAKTLGEVARVSALHAHVVRTGIERSLHGNPKKAPRDLHALLELFRELVVEAGAAVTDEETRSLLQSIKGSGKAANAAKALLDCDQSPLAQNVDVVMREALLHRVTRAERWATKRS